MDVLAGFAGGPFTEDEIDAAVAVVRAAVGWHIAPEVDDTLCLDVLPYQRLIRLPTKALSTVDEIRDMTTDDSGGTVIDPADYSVSTATAKIAKRAYSYWPHGYGAVEVDLHHGYTETPKDLYAVIAEAASLSRRDQTGASYSAGPYSVSFNPAAIAGPGSPLSSASTLNRYLLWQPGMV